MMKTKIYLGLTLAIAQLLPTSCVYEKEDIDSSAGKDPLVITLNLTVPPTSTATRGSALKLTPATKDESFIDILNNDYQICIFDKDGLYVADKLSEIECTEKSIGNGTATYSLTARLSLSGDEDMRRMSKFKVMVLANWKSFERSNTKPAFEYPSFTGYTVSGDTKNIYKDGDNFNFTLKDQGDTWVPSIDKKRAIPMFGITEELDLQFVMDMSKYGDVPIFNVPMLRSIAKVEIIDESGQDKISSVSLSKVNKNGRYIPDISGISDWETDQVSSPSLPQSPETSEHLQFFQETRDNKRVYVAYIPEMDLTMDRPNFRVYSGTKEIITPFNNYDTEGKVVTTADKMLKYVLRNHIYRYNVTVKDDKSLQVQLNILPWDMEWDEDGPWYFDSPEVAENGFLNWITTTDEITNPDYEENGEEPIYASNGYVDNKDDLILTMKDGNVGYVEGSFTLKAPKNGKWHAEFANLDGKGGDAFEFYNDGTKTYDSGLINGNPCIIRIKNKEEQVNTRDNQARLIIFVEYPGQAPREVKVAINSAGDLGNYTIVQKQTDIY